MHFVFAVLAGRSCARRRPLASFVPPASRPAALDEVLTPHYYGAPNARVAVMLEMLLLLRQALAQEKGGRAEERAE